LPSCPEDPSLLEGLTVKLPYDVTVLSSASIELSRASAYSLKVIRIVNFFIRETEYMGSDLSLIPEGAEVPEEALIDSLIHYSGDVNAPLHLVVQALESFVAERLRKLEELFMDCEVFEDEEEVQENEEIITLIPYAVRGDEEDDDDDMFDLPSISRPTLNRPSKLEIPSTLVPNRHLCRSPSLIKVSPQGVEEEIDSPLPLPAKPGKFITCVSPRVSAPWAIPLGDRY
jgi:hypothetical protein